MGAQAFPQLGEPMFADARENESVSQLVLWPAMETLMDELDTSGEADKGSLNTTRAARDLGGDAQPGAKEGAAGATTTENDSEAPRDKATSSISPTVLAAVVQQSVLSMQNFAAGSPKCVPMPTLSPRLTNFAVKEATEMSEPTKSILGLMGDDASNMRRPGSLVEDDDGESNGVQGREFELNGGDGTANKKPRFVWSAELHRRFEIAVAELGIDAAKPQAIAQLMGLKGDEAPSRQNIKSHLQKYRLYMKKKGGSAAPPRPDITVPPANEASDKIAAGVEKKQPSDDHSLSLGQLSDLSVSLFHENGEVNFLFNDTPTLAAAPSTAPTNMPCGLTPTSSASSPTTVHSSMETDDLADCEVLLEALDEAMLRSLSEPQEPPKESGPPSSAASTVSIAAWTPKHVTSRCDGIAEETDDAELHWTRGDLDGLDMFLNMSTAAANADQLAAWQFESRKRRNVEDFLTLDPLVATKRSRLALAC